MARNGDGGSRDNLRGYETGRDAAYIKPRLIPDYELLPRDDSGGPDFNAYTMEFGDSGYVTGDKAHLSARGGKDDPVVLDEQSEMPRARAANAATRGKLESAPKAPAKSVRDTKSER